ncbi:MAG: FG-GAP repeat protein [Nitrospirae bacterium]|nr:FG-GAP repeat protein [Nitrospirota bacterium]
MNPPGIHDTLTGSAGAVGPWLSVWVFKDSSLTVQIGSGIGQEDGSFPAIDIGDNQADSWNKVYVVAADAIFVKSPATTMINDVTPPNTGITSSPPYSTNLTYANLYFTATQTGSTFQCKLDAQSYAVCTSPASYSGLGVGTHRFYVKATDVAGNMDATPAIKSWTIDLTPPNTTMTSFPPSPTNQTTAAFSFSSNESGSSFRCRMDSAASYSVCSSPKTTSNLAAGVHTFYVYAVDRAGNSDATPASYSWTIDLTSPDTTLSATDGFSVLSSGEITTSTFVQFTFGSTESSSFFCQLDIGTPAPCGSPVEFTVSQGAHAFSVYAVDQAGNNDPTPAGITWTVDTPPTVRLLTAPPPWTNTAEATFAFSASEEGCLFECALDTESFSPCVSPFPSPAQSDGNHAFHVKATDTGGAVSPTVHHTWSVDTVVPDTLMTPDPPLTTGPDATFGFVSSEPSTSSFECSLDGGLYRACVPAASYTFLPAGSHAFSVRARDLAGNVDPMPASHAWTVDVERPSFGGVISATAISASMMALSWEPATDNLSPSDRISYRICQSSFSGDCGSNFVATATAPSGATSYSQEALMASTSYFFVVRAVDEAGNEDWNVNEVTARTLAAPGSLLMTLNGDRAGGNFGTAGTVLGDIDGDGKDEFAVSQPGSWDGSGQVFVYSWADPMASPSGLDLRYQIPNPGNSRAFGDMVQGGGDVNGDGTPDLLISGRWDTEGGDSVYVHSGRDGSLLFRLQSPALDDGFGWSAAILDDLDRDGHAEVLVGAPRAYDMFGRAGLAYLYSGADGTLLRAPCNMAYSETEFGYSVSAIGDVDGDGTGDYAIGAPRDLSDGPSPNRTGVVWVFSGAEGNLLYHKTGTNDLERFGHVVSGGFDLKGDGSPDLVVASSQWGNVTLHALSGRDGSVLWQKTDVALPISISRDLNGDGFADILIRSNALSGVDGSWLFNMPMPVPSIQPMMGDADFGHFVSPAGDVNGDGFTDVLIGAPGTTVASPWGNLDFAGAAYVFTGGRP